MQVQMQTVMQMQEKNMQLQKKTMQTGVQKQCIHNHNHKNLINHLL